MSSNKQNINDKEPINKDLLKIVEQFIHYFEEVDKKEDERGNEE